MRKLSDDASFAKKTHDDARIHGKHRRQNFHRNESIDVHLARNVNLSHTAGSQEGFYFEAIGDNRTIGICRTLGIFVYCIHRRYDSKIIHLATLVLNRTHRRIVAHFFEFAHISMNAINNVARAVQPKKSPARRAYEEKRRRQSSRLPQKRLQRALDDLKRLSDDE